MSCFSEWESQALVLSSGFGTLDLFLWLIQLGGCESPLRVVPRVPVFGVLV